MLGLEQKIVKLLPHDERWHELFAAEKSLILDAVGEFVAAVEHVGSTSICGIAAKPILDIAVSISCKSNGEKCVAPLEKIGYEYRGENGIAGRFYFVKGAPRTHHLHLLAAQSEEFRNHLRFRDYLRANKSAADRYDRLKKELAEKFPADREAYLDGKDAFIRSILKTSAPANVEPESRSG